MKFLHLLACLRYCNDVGFYPLHNEWLWEIQNTGQLLWPASGGFKKCCKRNPFAAPFFYFISFCYNSYSTLSIKNQGNAFTWDSSLNFMWIRSLSCQPANAALYYKALFYHPDDGWFQRFRLLLTAVFRMIFAILNILSLTQMRRKALITGYFVGAGINFRQYDVSVYMRAVSFCYLIGLMLFLHRNITTPLLCKGFLSFGICTGSAGSRNCYVT